jgi:two-component system, LuxR family, response regulator FixJ
MMQDGNRPLVIVIDDDEAVRDSLRFLLDIAGYDVVTFDSAQAYLDRTDRQGATCMLLDQHMPNTTGLELLTLLRHGGSPSSDLVRQAIALGAARVLEKPLADDALLHFVACAAAGACPQ